MIIDHIGFTVSKYEECKAFYRQALAPIGIEQVMEFEKFKAVGFGKNKKPEFWLSAGESTNPRIHVCFAAESREHVDQFYEAATKAGGACNGKPGVREIYHPNYYGAFVLDPDGNNIEAVHHG